MRAPKMTSRDPSYNLDGCELAVVRDLCERYHGYGSVGNNATYAFAVWEDETPVAAYVWQPPPSHRRCLLALHANRRNLPRAEMEAKPMLLLDGSGYQASLYTLPSFSCSAFESR
jgi:hypothetical protein